MKKAIIILSIIFYTSSIKSQQFEIWSSPMALTDSLSFNSNPEVMTIFNSVDSYMFYEKRQNQSGMSQIWWRKISEPMSDEQIFINGPSEYDYRNPKVMFDSYLIYECNASGNYDLYGIKFDEFGTIGNSFQITNTEYDENSFYPRSFHSIVCCWESEGNIIVSNTIEINEDTLRFTDLITIDTGNCFDPFCKYHFIVWRKIENNESHIYYSEIAWPSTQWSEPDTIIHTGDNINLSISRALFSDGYHTCWQASNNIYFYDDSYGANPEIFSPDIPNITNYYEPTAFNLDLTAFYFPELYSFVGETDSIRNIYILENMISGNVTNITEDSHFNKNPILFGAKYCYEPIFDIYNIWQTEINGYDVLFKSCATYIIADIKENKTFQLDISPNPVTNNQNIVINSPENIVVKSVNVYSASGGLVQKKKFSLHSSRYEFTLNNYLPGVYFVKIQTSHGKIVRKLIKK